jgi:sulfonate dioxygenase
MSSTIVTESQAAQASESTMSLPLLCSGPGEFMPRDRGQGPFEEYPYKNLLPKVFPKAGETDPPLKDFVHVDPGHRALSHSNPRAFLKNATRIANTCPSIGTEVEGVNLTKLTSDEKDELALEVAKRKVMIFRDQHDFFNAGGEFWKEFGSHFGRLHVHPTGGHPDDLPEIHMIYRDENTVYYDTENITRGMWHTDMSHERQPPGLTSVKFFYRL